MEQLAMPDLDLIKQEEQECAPGAGGLLFAGYCALTLALAAVLLVRRDT